MYESGVPSSTLKGMHRSELEGTGGTTTVIYSDKTIQIFLPMDVIIKCERNIDLKSLDITIDAKDINITCNKLDIKATKVTIDADVEIRGDLTVTDGIVRLN